MTTRHSILISFSLLIAVTATLAVISVSYNTDAYTSPWMVTLWTLTAVAAIFTCLRRRLWRRPVIAALHFSLLLILAGALLTHVSGESRDIHLRLDGNPVDGMVLENFEVITRPGSNAPRDFVSHVSCNGKNVTISMNKPGQAGGCTMMQSSYDSDMKGVVITVTRDPWGTGTTYSGYILLILSSIGYFFTRHSIWRTSLRRLTMPAVMLTALSGTAAVPAPETTAKLAATAVYHNSRITSVEILARDFTTTIGCDRNPMETFTGLLFDFGKWRDEKIIKVKNPNLRQIMNLNGRRASFDDFIDAISSGRIAPDSPDDRKRYGDDLSRFESVAMLVDGTMLRLFPVKSRGNIEWMSPGSNLPDDIDNDKWMFVRKFFGLLNENVVTGDTDTQLKLLDALERYQRLETAGAIPSAKRLRLERFYMALASQAWPAMTVAACGLLLFIAMAANLRCVKNVALVVAVPVSAWLTLLTALRWIVSGHIPLSNGYETMMFLAWCLALASVLSSKEKVIPPMGVLSAGLAMCVASMSGAGASVSPLMPVLESPLLSIHVALVMAAYALFFLMALNGIIGIISSSSRGHLACLSRVMLYPALLSLAAGIFVGAVWANVSWGRYWGWDPKEVWALITMLVYSLPAHPGLLPGLSRPKSLHIYCIVAFISVIITYFGVNFFLGGLHSYA